MSADNVIYVLELKDQYRIKYMSAPDNIWWSHIDGQSPSPVASRIVGYFGKSPFFKKKDDAYKHAFKLYEKEEYVEYGVSSLCINKTWLQILKEAREYISKEKLHIISLEYMDTSTKEEIIEDLNYSYSDVLNQIVRTKGK